MNDQLVTINGILLAIMVCQLIQVIRQWFIHLELMQLSYELRRIANILERMEK